MLMLPGIHGSLGPNRDLKILRKGPKPPNPKTNIKLSVRGAGPTLLFLRRASRQLEPIFWAKAGSMGTNIEGESGLMAIPMLLLTYDHYRKTGTVAR